MGTHEGIYHYWLIPPSFAQPDIPSAVDINHDFNIMDPFFCYRREEHVACIDFSHFLCLYRNSEQNHFQPLLVMQTKVCLHEA